MPIAIVALLLLTGCPPPQEENGKEKPATPEEIRAEGQKILQAMSQLAGTPPDQLASKAQQLSQQMRTFREKHGQTETGKEMIRNITQTGYNNAQMLFQMKEYALCIAACDLVRQINPTHEPTNQLRQQALEEQNKPKVALRGFFEEIASEKLYAMVEVTYQGQKESMQVTVGDEFYGYRLMKIIKSVQGSPKGIILRYIKTGSENEIMLGA
jgi:hypothetical protein